MRRLLILALLGCASGPPVTPSERVVLVDERGNVYRTIDNPDEGAEQQVPATKEQTMRALLGVYEEIGLDVNTIDTNGGRVGARNVNAPSRLGGQPLSHYFDCGLGQMGGAAADAYAVVLNLESVAEPQAQETTVRTVLSGSAQQRGVSADPIRCTSRGTLEHRVNVMTAARLAK